MRAWTWGLVLVTASVVSLAAQQDVTRAEGDRMAQKLAAIEARGSAPVARNSPALRTSFTDREVNAYFRYNCKDRLPPGVVDPQVTIADATRVDARAMVDL